MIGWDKLVQHMTEPESKRIARRLDELDSYKRAGCPTYDDEIERHRLRRRLVQIEIEGHEVTP